MQQTHVKDELIKETHDSLRVSCRAFASLIKLSLPVRNVFRSFKPAVDPVPDESVPECSLSSMKRTSNAGNRSELAYHPCIVLWGTLSRQLLYEL